MREGWGERGGGRQSEKGKSERWKRQRERGGRGEREGGGKERERRREETREMGRAESVVFMA